MCQPQSKELGFGDFQSWSGLLSQDLGTVGTGDSDLDLGLTIIHLERNQEEMQSSVASPNVPNVGRGLGVVVVVDERAPTVTLK